MVEDDDVWDWLDKPESWRERHERVKRDTTAAIQVMAQATPVSWGIAKKPSRQRRAEKRVESAMVKMRPKDDMIDYLMALQEPKDPWDE